ncbi:oligosaccharide flippase family protein [Devosia psychrophila]|uniref:Membrane protein involved in the export of O-antigen and teichoic acid n=1 Tax=Devosia psychrophila TaxID=728005 RepID=A0A0F5PYT8_9HYPH|nr:oligosaccharide flippase family protein [Devosia psychrophila]KKC33818.1 polysaccharide biosynthesis protein [Devosia psychrophila]SFD37858.1 Membrane protein involved in the export of O-antigen and teichoic acid [Devosia psychrophila]
MLRQASTYLAANIIAAALGLASVVIFTRIMTPAEYGIYIVGFSAAALISSLLFGGIKSSIVPFTAEGGVDIRLTAAIPFAVLVLLIPLLYFGIIAFAPSLSTYLLPAIFLAFAIGAFEFCLEIFRARQQTTLYLIATIVRAAAALVFSLVLILVFGWGGVGLLISISLSYVIAGLIFSREIWRAPLKPFDKKLFQGIIAFGLPMTISGAVFMLQALLDRFTVASLMGEHAAGIYGASADLVRQIILFPGVAIGSAIAPIAVRLLAKSSNQEVDRHLVESTELLLAVLAPATVGLTIVAHKLSFFVFGEDFRQAAAVLIPIISVAWLLRSISYQLIHVSFQMTRKPSLLILQGVGTLLVNGALLAVFVPNFGLIGAAWSVLVSELLGVMIGFALARRAYPLPLDPKPWFKVALATAVMAVPTFLIGRQLSGTGFVDLAIPVIIGIALYAAACFALDIAGIRTRAATIYRARKLAS